MLSSLSISFLKGLTEVEDLRETICQLQALEAPPELESLSQEGFCYLGSQMPLAVTVQKCASTVSAYSCEILAS